MAEKNAIYKCELCGNVVSVIEAHDGILVCCGQDMVLQKEKNKDVGMEKHVPVVKTSDGKTIVNVGSIDHPMEKEHFIELIQLMKGNDVIAETRLKPGEKPNAVFCISENGLKARAYCNVHGLWKS